MNSVVRAFSFVCEYEWWFSFGQFGDSLAFERDGGLHLVV